MKKGLAREFLMLSLPSLLLMAVVAWLSGGRALWEGVTRPKIEMKALRFLRKGPLYGQNEWNDGDFQLMMPMTVSDPFKALRKTTVTLGAARFVSANGGLLSEPPAMQQDFSTSGSANPNPNSSPPSSLSFDLDRVPPSLGEITLHTSWEFSDGRSQPFSVVVRPAWFGLSPRTLQLVSARVLPPDTTSDGGVSIVVRTLDPQKLEIDANDAHTGSATGWTTPDGSSHTARHQLLWNWSPRFESRDGQYNSHDARDAYVWNAMRTRVVSASQASGVPISLPQKFLAEFSPRIETLVPRQRGKNIEIIYRFHELANEPRAQTFVTDIGVPLDGFLSVTVPLPMRKPSTSVQRKR